MSYLGIFGLQFQKTMVIFEISTLGFVKNEFLTHRLSFCIGSVYSKNEGADPASARLYKVCPVGHT